MCEHCGEDNREIRKRGIARLRHRLQIPKGIDFWQMVAAERHDTNIKDVTSNERYETKLKGMELLTNSTRIEAQETMARWADQAAANPTD